MEPEIIVRAADEPADAHAARSELLVALDELNPRFAEATRAAG